MAVSLRWPIIQRQLGDQIFLGITIAVDLNKKQAVARNHFGQYASLDNIHYATQSGTQVIFVFSDMKEELPSGVKRKFADDEFDGIDIAAMNVIKLTKDSANPEVYRKRLKKWNKRIMSSGANSWTTLLDATKIQEFIDKAK